MTVTIQEETDEYVKIRIEQMDLQIANIYDKEYFAGFESVHIEQIEEEDGRKEEDETSLIEEKEETFYSRIQNYIQRYLRIERDLPIPSENNAPIIMKYVIVITIKKPNEMKVKRLDNQVNEMEEIEKMKGDSSIYVLTRGMSYIMIEEVIEEVDRSIEEIEKRGKRVKDMKKENIFNINGKYLAMGMEISDIMLENDNNEDKESNKKKIMREIMQLGEKERLRIKDTMVYKMMR